MVGLNQCILLTACVNPGNMSNTVLKNESERLEQYKKALHYYLIATKLPIVFCENTNFDFSLDYQEYINNGRLEFITFDGNNYDINKGKGFGEALIIRYAINHSRIIKHSSIIIKITGRLICKNIKKLICKCDNPSYIYSCLYQDKNSHILTDSRLIVAPFLFWKNHFIHSINDIDDSKNSYFEHVFYQTAQNSLKEGFHDKEIWFPLEIQGISGTSGFNYSTGIIPIIKFYIHFFLHRIGYYGPLSFWK